MADRRQCPAIGRKCCELHGRPLPLGELGRCVCSCHDEPARRRGPRLDLTPDQELRELSNRTPDEARALLLELAQVAELAAPGLRYSAPSLADRLLELATRARHFAESGGAASS